MAVCEGEGGEEGGREGERGIEKWRESNNNNNNETRIRHFLYQCSARGVCL